MSAIKLYVPRDSAALALGADDTAATLAAEAARRGVAIELVRNGSRGLFWLEPLVEVQTAQGRVAYGPVEADDVPALFDALIHGAEHPLCHGLTDDIPYLKKQERLTFSRVGITDPLSLADYQAHEGFAGLRKALAMSSSDIVQTVLDSGLRGRGAGVLQRESPIHTIARPGTRCRRNSAGGEEAGRERIHRIAG